MTEMTKLIHVYITHIFIMQTSLE